MNPLANIVKSILILGSTSAVISYILDIKYNNFWQSFICIIFIQIVASNIYRKFANILVQSNNKKLSILEASSLNTAGVEVSCAYCGAENIIPISFSSSNDFKCNKCNKENAIYLNITTAQKTDTSVTSSITVNSFDDNIEIAKSKILNSRDE